MSSATSLEGAFERELERRLAILEDPDYRASAEEYQPLPRNHWYCLFTLAIVIPLILALLSYFTW